MSLPSKYAPGGISESESTRPVTVGRYQKKPVEYIVKTIEDKVDNAARFSRASEDIEMVPIDDYEEAVLISDYVVDSRPTMNYDEMEIDGVFSDMATEPNTSYLVVDTNFALSHLNILDDIKKMASRYRVKIIIPMTVMRELDGLKGSSKSVDDQSLHNSALKGKTIGLLARWANDWIFNALSDVNSPVKGQTMKQRVDRSAIKDDAILDCCLFFKDNYQASLVVLLSNDKNLCLKALANEVLTVSFTPEMNAKLICENVFNESVSQFGSYKEPVLIEQKPKPAESVPRSNGPTDFNTISQTIYTEVFRLVKSAVHHVMVSVYEDDLDLVQNYNKDSINDLTDVDQVIRRFWISSFTDFLFKMDYRKGVITHEPRNSQDLNKFVHQWSEVLLCIYERLLGREQQQALHKLIERWESMLSSLT